MSFDIGDIHLGVACFGEGGVFLHGGVFNIHEGQGKNKLVPTFYQWLAKNNVWLQIQTGVQVLCEQQVGAATKNRIMASTLEGYCLSRQIDIQYISSNKKFTGMPENMFPSNVCKSTITDKNYGTRKQASVYLMVHIAKLYHMSAVLDVARKMDKRDDFADAFCQGIYWLHEKGRMPAPPAKIENASPQGWEDDDEICDIDDTTLSRKKRARKEKKATFSKIVLSSSTPKEEFKPPPKRRRVASSGDSHASATRNSTPKKNGKTAKRVKKSASSSSAPKKKDPVKKSSKATLKSKPTSKGKPTKAVQKDKSEEATRETCSSNQVTSRAKSLFVSSSKKLSQTTMDTCLQPKMSLTVIDLT